MFEDYVNTIYPMEPILNVTVDGVRWVYQSGQRVSHGMQCPYGYIQLDPAKCGTFTLPNKLILKLCKEEKSNNT